MALPDEPDLFCHAACTLQPPSVYIFDILLSSAALKLLYSLSTFGLLTGFDLHLPLFNPAFVTVVLLPVKYFQFCYLFIMIVL